MAENPLVRRPYVGGTGNVFPGQVPPGYERDRNGLLIPGIDHSAPINYTLGADGSVEPIAGGGGGGGGGGSEPTPGGGGGSFPPVPSTLNGHAVVHSDSFLLTNPDEGLTSWNIAYIPPSNTKYLLALYNRLDRLPNGDSWSSGTTITLNGAGPSGSSGSQFGTGTGGYRQCVARAAWSNPSAGTVNIDVSGNSISTPSLTYVTVLLISICGTTPNTGTGGVSPGNSTGASNTGSFSLSFPGVVAVHSVRTMDGPAGPFPESSSYWNWFKIYSFTIKAATGNNEMYKRLETFIAPTVLPSGSNSYVFVWPDSGMDGGYTLGGYGYI